MTRDVDVYIELCDVIDSLSSEEQKNLRCYLTGKLETLTIQVLVNGVSIDVEELVDGLWVADKRKLLRNLSQDLTGGVFNNDEDVVVVQDVDHQGSFTQQAVEVFKELLDKNSSHLQLARNLEKLLTDE